MLDGKQLRKLFHKFNLEYFGGRLPSYSIRSVGHITSFGESGICRKKRRIIEIQRELNGVTSVSTLLHEMAHAATTDGHGNKWKAEMIRLREAGAPLDASDSRIEMQDWSGTRVTQAHFSNAARAALTGNPNSTARQVIKWFIESYGGPRSVAEFLRRYQWAPRVFGVLKKEQAARAKARDASESLGGDHHSRTGNRALNREP